MKKKIIFLIFVYNVYSLSNGIYLIVNPFNQKKFLTLSKNLDFCSFKGERSQQFRLKKVYINKNYYYIFQSVLNNKYISITEDKNIAPFKIDEYNIEQFLLTITTNEINESNYYSKNNWIFESKYYIRNKINNCSLGVQNNHLKCLNEGFIKLIKIYEEPIFYNKYKEIINKEPIDVVYNYVDLTDPKLKERRNISNSIYDYEDSELVFSIRSVLTNIPWIRFIYVITPNEKIKYFKKPELIKEKIKIINDFDYLGYYSANIYNLKTNLFKLKKYGLSKNFILLDDDFFIGKPLRKENFIYYDKKTNKIKPLCLTNIFSSTPPKKILKQLNNLLKLNSIKQYHSGIQFFYILTNTLYFFYNNSQVFFQNKFNLNNINKDKIKFKKYKNEIKHKFILIPEYTHNAYIFNQDNLKNIYNIFEKYYPYFKLIEKSVKRDYLNLEPIYFDNMYGVNFQEKKIKYLDYLFIKIHTFIKIKNFKSLPSLFCINTISSKTKKQIKKFKIILNNIFPKQSEYELKQHYYYFIIYRILVIVLVIFAFHHLLLVLFKNSKKKNI